MSELPEVRGSSAAEIAHSIEQSILAGYYPSGMRLPTVRALAEHLSVNKNTVSRAYQILGRSGYLEAIRGRGAFVCLPDKVAPPSVHASSDWQGLMRAAFVSARKQSVPHAQVLAAALRVADDVFKRIDVHLAFVECNETDSADLSAKLQESIGYPVQSLLLADCQAEPDSLLANVDIITTSFFHLSELRRLVGQRKEDVIGLNVIPTLEVLLDVARLEVMVIGIVCDTPSAQANLVHIVQTYHPEVTVLSVLASETDRLQQLLTKVDAVVVTRSAADLLATHSLSCPTIVVHWTIEQQSVEFVRQKLEERLWAADKSHLTSEWPQERVRQGVLGANAGD